MSSWRVSASGPLRGRLRLPCDLQIGQEALLWAALAEGASELSGLGLGRGRGLEQRRDHGQLVRALREMGVSIAETEHGVHVQGVGLMGLRMPKGALDAGESVSTLELLSALLSGQRFGTRIEARGAALRHSLRTLLPPLRARGAQIAGRSAEDGGVTAPVAVAPLLAHELLSAVEIQIPSGDATTKRGLLISGLFARGVTAINEGLLSRDHTERALVALGVPLQTMGPLTLLDTGEAAPRWDGFRWQIPADFSLAAFVIAAALAVPFSDVSIEQVSINRSRTAFLDALRHAGAEIEITPKGDLAGNEPVADIRVRGSSLRGLKALGELSQRLLDDVPAYLALSAATKARVGLRDAGALRLQADNPLKASGELLRAFGADCTSYEDGLDVSAANQLRGAEVAGDASGPSKLLGLVLGLSAAGETVIENAAELDALYPGVRAALSALGARIETREPERPV